MSEKLKHNGPWRKPLADRFWPKVDKSGGSEACWLWTAYKNKGGYGVIGVPDYAKGTDNAYAHRASWFLDHGEWPADGLYVCHSCDNPPCVNPKHLFLGTDLDNQRDCIEKGRRVVKGAVGERNKHARLTDEQVIILRAEWKAHQESGKHSWGWVKKQVEKLGVSRCSIGKIIHNRGWTHLLDDKETT